MIFTGRHPPVIPVFVLSETVLVLEKTLMMTEPIFENGPGSALECAAIHDILLPFEAIDAELTRFDKTNLKRIVSMLARLIHRTETVSEGSIEYEYRDIEYEMRHEQNDGPMCSIGRF